MFSKTFVIDLAERVIFTFAEAFLAVLVASGTGFVNIDTVKGAAIAGGAAVLSVLKGIASSLKGDPESASAVQ